MAACFTPAAEVRALVPPGFREHELHLVESGTEEVGDRLHIGYRFEGVAAVAVDLLGSLASSPVGHRSCRLSGPRRQLPGWRGLPAARGPAFRSSPAHLD